MPYVPSLKTDGKSTDRIVIDAALAPLVQSVAAEIINNFSLRPIYERVFIQTAEALYHLLHLLTTEEIKNTFGYDSAAIELANAIYKTGVKYGYEGAYLGEFNYAFTRFIQLVPQAKVERGDWKDELRYWLYAETVTALRHAEGRTEDLDIGVDGVFRDIKDEYKWEVNRSYEIAQILKSGHCYFTPYYNRAVEVVDETGKLIGHIEIMLKRSADTLNKDLLDYQLILKQKEDKKQTMPGQDFDRGMVPMTTDCGRPDCDYHLPHYHCAVCGAQVNSDDLARDYHPCCSEACFIIYDKRT